MHWQAVCVCLIFLGWMIKKNVYINLHRPAGPMDRYGQDSVREKCKNDRQSCASEQNVEKWKKLLEKAGAGKKWKIVWA